jgi:capsular polysaccharide transport system permease protein
MSASYIHTKRKTRLTRLILKSISMLYLISMAVIIFYLWSFTQNRYISTASFKVSKQSGLNADGGIFQLGLPGDTGSIDSQVAIGYINSSDLLLELEKEFKLVDHYSAPKQDFVFHMDRDSNLEERLKYYRKRILAHYDIASGLTVITVDTFKPELSKAIADSLLKKAEAFINKTNQAVANQQLDFIRSEVERTSLKVEELNAQLINLQNEHQLIKPEDMISASLKAIQEMRLENLKLESQLSSIQRDSPNSPRLESIKSKSISLNELIDAEMAKFSGTEKDRLNQILLKFKQLELRTGLATRLRTSAELQLEKVQVDAIAQSRFFSIIQHPYLPEDIGIPRRPYATATILCLGLLLFIVIRVFSQSVLERG